MLTIKGESLGQMFRGGMSVASTRHLYSFTTDSYLIDSYAFYFMGAPVFTIYDMEQPFPMQVHTHIMDLR